MKTLILAVATFMLLVGCEKTETIADIVVTEQPVGDVTIDLVSVEPYAGIDNYFIATYCVSNNSVQTFDSVKVTFTNVTTPRTYRFLIVKPADKYFPTVTYNVNNTVTNPIKTTLEWW